jgi:SAM-dependent methyltransferase
MHHTSGLNDIIEWDVVNWSTALEYWKKNSNQDIALVKALEIGSGYGGLSLWAALNGMKVLCTDIEGPSNEALEKHKKYNVTHLINYETLNALSIPYREEFDVVLFKSVLGGIGRFNNKADQIKAIYEIHKSLKNGGELWFAENLVASPIHQILRRKYIAWGSQWRYVSIQEMKEYLSIFSEAKYTTVGFLGTFGRSESQRAILGKIDRIIADKLVPESWRYIVIGVARK